MNKRGSLLITLMILTLLLTLGAALYLRGMVEVQLVRINADSTQAFWLAEAGVHRTLNEYKNNNCAGFVQQGTNTACTSCACNGVNKTMAVSLSGSGDYDVTLNSSNTTITSTGSVPSRSASKKLMRMVKATLTPNSLFNGALFTKNSIRMSNSILTDSYNSSIGAYNVNGNFGYTGHVGTNATTLGAMTMSNSAQVGGNASTGAGGTIINNNTSSVTGTKTYTNKVALPDVAIPSSLTSLPLIGHIHNSNGYAQTITAGSYKYTGITLENNTVLTIKGDVTLYLNSSGKAINLVNSSRIDITNGGSLTIYTDGYMGMSNGSTINNVSQTPSKLQIYSKSTGAGVSYNANSGFTLANNTTMYGTVYMPNAPFVSSNSAQFYGAIVAKDANLSNSTQIHYDQALSTLINPFSGGGITLTNWQEI